MDSAQKARLAGEVLRVERGVLTALFDPVSRNMLLHVHPDSQLDKVKIDALLTSQGMSVRCLHRKPVDGQPFQSIDPTNCNEAVGLDE